MIAAEPTPARRTRHAARQAAGQAAGHAAPQAARPAEPAVFDRELARRHDRPGPRYTSYPPAPHFSADFGPADHRRLLAEGAATSGLPLSLYVHVPFCRTRCLFCGCNVTIARGTSRADAFLDTLEREIAAVAPICTGPAGENARRVSQIHWGGGTPNFLTPAQMRRLAAMLGAFGVDADTELAVELDPRRLTDEALDTLAGIGLRRASIGLQDLDPQVQEAVRRVQPEEQVVGVIEGLRRRGVASVNIDLIYGLPHQTPESFADTLERVVAMRPDRVALFNFAYLPERFAHQRALDPAALPDGATKLALLELGVETLTGAGWRFIGMDHFALPGDSLSRALDAGTLSRDFQGYTALPVSGTAAAGACETVALGPSAISTLAGGYAQNHHEPTGWTAAVESAETGGFATTRGHRLTAEDRLRRRVIYDLMGRFRVDKAAVEAEHGIRFDEHFADALAALAPLAADGLVELSAGALEVTPTGRFFVRNLAMPFDAWLGTRPVAWSRTV